MKESELKTCDNCWSSWRDIRTGEIKCRKCRDMTPMAPDVATCWEPRKYLCMTGHEIGSVIIKQVSCNDFDEWKVAARTTKAAAIRSFIILTLEYILNAATLLEHESGESMIFRIEQHPQGKEEGKE